MVDKLIGNNPKQVPTNSMLGNSAYLDQEDIITSSGGIIKGKRIPLTISGHTDVHVYDTRLDSDGGAWRKRTNNTSWYNEELNTSIRGSRREFPVVAIIVSTTTDVIIYDGDDPNTPMWMKFEATTQNGMADKTMLQYRGYSGYRCGARNGYLYIGQTTSGDNYGSPLVNFISEEVIRFDPQSTAYEGGAWKGSIAERNTKAGYVNDQVRTGNNGSALQNSQVQACKVHVTPDCIIDEYTGLPTPNIFIATMTGLSVVRRIGEEWDIENGGETNSSWNVKAIMVDHNHNVWGCEASNYSAIQLLAEYPYKQVNAIGTGTKGYGQTGQVATVYGRNTAWPKFVAYISESGGDTLNGRLNATDEFITLGSSPGLSMIADNPADREQSLSVNISSQYNSGYLPGGCESAFICDTEAGSLVGTNLIANPSFGNGTTAPWQATHNATISIASQQLSWTAGGANNSRINCPLNEPLAPGRVYTLTFQIASSSTSRMPRVFMNSVTSLSGGQTLQNTNTADVVVANQYVHYTFTAENAWTYLQLESNGYGGNANWVLDFFSLTQGIHNRTSYGVPGNISNGNSETKGIAVVGHLERGPVAPGAELCGISDWSASSYLNQRPNKDNQYGSDAWCFMGWANGNGTILSLGTADSNEMARIYLDATNYGVYVDYGIGSPYAYIQDTADRLTPASGGWQHIAIYTKPGQLDGPVVYVNGARRVMSVAGAVPSTFPWQTNYELTIGTGYGGTNIFDGQLALIRFGRDFLPSQEQIKKIYSEEKKMFMPNAKCTLVGDADRVYGTAWDPIEKVLHAGTLDGRSTFRGITRVDENTRTPITGGMSASGGVIVGRN